jgi:hypothetical protein
VLGLTSSRYAVGKIAMQLDSQGMSDMFGDIVK